MDIVSWTFADTLHDQDKPILIDAINPKQGISTLQARSYVKRMIAGLKRAGLQTGDTVCILSFGSIFYSIFYLAIIGAGGIVTAGSPGSSETEIQHIIKKCSVKHIISCSSVLDKVTKALQSCDNLATIPIYVYSDSTTDSAYEPAGTCKHWTELLDHGLEDWKPLDRDAAATTVAVFGATSGTTAAPKFAAIPHNNYVRTAEYLRASTPTKPYDISRLVALPLMHAFIAPLVHCASFRSGVPTYIMARFSVSGFLDAIAKYGITEIPVVPTVIAALLPQISENPAKVSSLREIITAGAPLHQTLAKAIRSYLQPGACIRQVYGLTEIGWITMTPPSSNDMTTALYTDKGSEMHDSQATIAVGSALPGIDLAIWSSTDPDSLLPVDKPGFCGELLVRASSSFLYYLDSPKDTKTAFKHSASGTWFRTGDLAITDANKELFVIDRIKSILKVRGWQVSPSEIENVILRHSQIADAAVIGTPDRTNGYGSGELPLACVVQQEAKSAPNNDVRLKGELFELLRTHLSRYKIPVDIIWVKTLPRNPAGKLIRRRLVEEMSTLGWCQ